MSYSHTILIFAAYSFNFFSKSFKSLVSYNYLMNCQLSNFKISRSFVNYLIFEI